MLTLTKNHQVVSKLLSYHVTRKISISSFYTSRSSEWFHQKIFVSSELSIFPSALQYYDASVQTQLFCRYATVNLHYFMHWILKWDLFWSISDSLFTILSSWNSLSLHSCPRISSFFHATYITFTVKSRWRSTEEKCKTFSSHDK